MTRTRPEQSFLHISRRRLIRAAAKIATLASVAPLSRAAAPRVAPEATRAERVFRARVRAAELDRDMPAMRHVANGDEARYAARWGNYSKGLPHDAAGQVDRAAYNSYLHAIASGRHDDFERIPLAG